MLFKIDVLENLLNSLGNTCAGVCILKRCRFLACNFTKMTSSQVFSSTFWEVFKNIFFKEHLWTTALAIPCKYRHINTFSELVFSKYLLEDLCLLILCWNFKTSKFHKEDYRRLFFNQPETVFEKGLWHSCFL